MSLISLDAMSESLIVSVDGWLTSDYECSLMMLSQTPTASTIYLIIMTNILRIS
jgi:hypothetical protein